MTAPPGIAIHYIIYADDGRPLARSMAQCMFCNAHESNDAQIETFAEAHGFKCRTVAALRALPKASHVPDGMTPVIGYRTWHITKGLLRARHIDVADSIWPAQTTYTATCSGALGAPHHPDDMEACSSFHGNGPMCGIYANKTMGQALAEVSRDDGCQMAIGEVYLWGRIIEHEHGWRAQYAYPKALMILSQNQDIVPIVAQTYRVPVTWNGGPFSAIVADLVKTYPMTAEEVEMATYNVMRTLKLNLAAQSFVFTMPSVQFIYTPPPTRRERALTLLKRFTVTPWRGGAPAPDPGHRP